MDRIEAKKAENRIVGLYKGIAVLCSCNIEVDVIVYDEMWVN